MKKKILVIGEYGIDQWWLGTVPRLCPEGPFPVFHPEKSYSNLGLAANVTANIQSLAPEFEIEFIHQEIPITKTRYVDEISNYTLIRVDENDVVPNFTLPQLQTLKNRILAKEFDAIIISDYNKNFLDERVIEHILLTARQAEIPSFLDTKKVLGLWTFDAFVVKINSKEWNEVINYRKKYKLELESRVAQNLIVTRGPDGCDLWEGNNTKISIPTKKVEISCLSGAGDSFLAALVVKYLETNDLHQSIKFGLVVASYVVTKRGVIAPKRKEIEEFIKL